MLSNFQEIAIAQELVLERDDLTVCYNESNYFVLNWSGTEIWLQDNEVGFIWHWLNPPEPPVEQPKPAFEFRLFGFSFSVFKESAGQ